MQPLDLLMLALATFYASYVVVNTKGPFDVFLAAREKLPHGGLLTCIYCVALWIGLLLYCLTFTRLAPVVTVLAGVGGAMFIYRWTGGSHV